MEAISSLEQAVEAFPGIKEFVDYVIATNGQETLKVEKGYLNWYYEHPGRGFYRADFKLDTQNPELFVFMREGMLGTDPMADPIKGKELIENLAEYFEEVRQIYAKCFVRNEAIYRYATPEEAGGQSVIMPVRDFS